MILYKYFPDNFYSYRAISIKGLWCHHPVKMNDPFECLGFVNRSFSDKQLQTLREIFLKSDDKSNRELANKKDNLLIDILNKQRREIIKQYAFCSLSETKDDIKMWSHYASNHKGFVVGFKFTKNQIDHHFQKVRYVNKVPQLNVRKFAEFMNGKYHHLSYLLSDVSVKSTDWKSEKEWRIWRNKPCYYRYELSNIDCIYFGVDCSIETKLIIARLTSDLGEKFEYDEMEFNDNPVGLKY
ncbi:MAG: DUF2971 domain-containing protein [Vicingaceae bacterium]